MAASALMSVLIVGIYLAIMCKFSLARAQLQEQTGNQVDASAVFTKGECYELKHDNKLMAEKIRILEENQKSLETYTKECENKRKEMKLELDTLWDGLDNQNASTLQTMAELETSINERSLQMNEQAIRALSKPTRCPSSYEYFADLNLCWRLEKTKTMNFLTASWQCFTEGGHLIILDSMAKIRFMHYYLIFKAPTVFTVYVGATDVMEEGKFTWINGKPVGTVPWCSGEPSAGSGEQCVVMEANNNYDFFDRGCNLQYYFLCQISL